MQNIPEHRAGKNLLRTESGKHLYHTPPLSDALSKPTALPTSIPDQIHNLNLF